MCFFKKQVTKNKKWSVGFIFIDRNLAVYFDSYGTEYILQEVLNKIKDKSITHNVFGIQDNESVMYRFYCMNLLAGKPLLDFTNLFSLNDYKKNDREYIIILKINMVEEGRLELRLRNIDETINYLLDEIKLNDLMSEKCNKTCKYLNYVGFLLILASTVTSCVSVSASTSLVPIPVGITNSVLGIKICGITGGIKKY